MYSMSRWLGYVLIQKTFLNCVDKARGDVGLYLHNDFPNQYLLN